MKIVNRNNRANAPKTTKGRNGEKLTSLRDVLGKNVALNFTIALRVGKRPVFQMNIFGAHDQFYVVGNDIELACFCEEESANDFMTYLKTTKFQRFCNTEQGKRLMNIIYLAYEKSDLAKLDVTKDGKSYLLDDLSKKQILK